MLSAHPLSLSFPLANGSNWQRNPLDVHYHLYYFVCKAAIGYRYNLSDIS